MLSLAWIKVEPVLSFELRQILPATLSRRRSLLRVLICPGLFFVFLSSGASATLPEFPQQEPGTAVSGSSAVELTPGRPLTVEMRGGEKHRYHTILEAGQYVEFTAEQKGIDVRLYLYDPAQTLLTRGESPNGKEGPETIPWIARTAGTYTLEVQANQGSAPSGQYELRIAQLRPVAPQDELLVRAASDLSEGVILEFDQDGPDPLSVAKYKAALPVLRQLQDLNRVGFAVEGLCVELQQLAGADNSTTLARSLYSESIPYCEEAEQFAEKNVIRKSQAPWTYRAGIAYDQTGQKDKAAVFYQKAASLYSGVEDKKMEARVLASLAYLQIKSGRYQDALSSLERECKLRESSDSSAELATCLNHLGFVYLQVGQKDKVLVTHEAAIEAAQRARDKGQEALALEYRGDFYVAAREPLKAMEEFRKEIPLRQATNDKAGETAAYLGLASACEFFFYGPENDKYRSQRREYLSQALEVARSGKLLHEQAHILRLIGTSYEVGWFTVTEAERKQLREDRDVLRESRTLYHTNGTPAEEAQVSIDLAKIDGKLDEGQEVISDLQKARALYHGAGDGDGEAEALDGIAKEYFHQKDLANALAAYRQLEQVRTAQNKPKETAFAIASQGKMQLAMGNTPEAIRLFELALATYPEKGSEGGRAECERYLAVAYLNQGQDDRALSAFNREFNLIKATNLGFLQFLEHRGATELWDPEMVARQKEIMAQSNLTSLPEVWDWFAFTSFTNWDDPYFVQTAGDIFRARHLLQAATSLNLAVVLQLEMELAIANEHLKAVMVQNARLKQESTTKADAAPATPPANNPVLERAARGDRLQAEGGRYAKRESCQKAILSFEQALAVRREVGNPKAIAETLTSMAAVWLSLNEGKKALAANQEASEKWHAAGDSKEEVNALLATGVVYNWLGERQKALTIDQQALQLANEKGLTSQASDALYRIGETYLFLGEKRKALENLLAAQDRSKSVDYPNGDGKVLALIGFSYASLGDQKASNEYYQLAITEYGRAFTANLVFYDLKKKSHLYNQLGDAYFATGDSEKALETFHKGLLIQRNFGSLAEQAYSLDKMGLIYLSLGGRENDQQAIESFEKSLEFSRTNGNPVREAEALHNLGVAYERTGEQARALANYNQALAIRYSLNDPEGQGETLDQLMRIWKSMNQPSVAVFYGKQAVNAYQQIRVNMQGISDKLQKSYLSSHSKTYRELADTLITEGRIPEAQQVLDLLKDEEYLDFVRRDGAEDAAGTASYDARENSSRQQFKEVQGRLLLAGRRFAVLSAQTELTTAEKAEFSELEKELVAANQAYDTYLASLPKQFSDRTEGEARTEVLREAKGLQETLRELGNGTVALYTVVSDDRYHVILITPDTQEPFSYEIKAADLNEKVQQFRAVLTHPRLDPVPLARELYTILVGPVAAALVDAQAKTLMWSLDGALRYVPIAALHDGHGYLVEKYDITMFTPASHSRLERPASAQWRGLGLGVSQGSHPLPYVKNELYSVIHDDSISNSGDGVISGKILLDNSFTKEAMKDALQHGKGYSVVHVASHFRFTAGNEYDSYLLLGGSEDDSDEQRHLSLAEIKNGTNIFHGVELLTLSACNTAVGSGEGSEVENFAVLAQLKGASAVIATLWPVADQSTMRLMQNFYRAHSEHPGQTKIGSLRDAQLSLLHGCREGDCGQRASGARYEPIDPDRKQAAQSPMFHPDPRAPFAHPYFWAPFVLVGNWR